MTKFKKGDQVRVIGENFYLKGEEVLVREVFDDTILLEGYPELYKDFELELIRPYKSFPKYFSHWQTLIPFIVFIAAIIAGTWQYIYNDLTIEGLVFWDGLMSLSLFVLIFMSRKRWEELYK